MIDCPDDPEILRMMFGGKWRLQVLKKLIDAPMRLSGLRRALPECSKKVLVDTLHVLERTQLVVRVEYKAKVRKVEYHIVAECLEDVRRLIRGIEPPVD